MRISDWSSDVCSSDLVAAEQSALPGRALVRRTVGAGEKRLGAGGGARPVGLDAIECPCTGQRPDLPPVEQPGVDTPREIVETREIADRPPHGAQRFPRLPAHSLHPAKRVTHPHPPLPAPAPDTCPPHLTPRGH